MIKWKTRHEIATKRETTTRNRGGTMRCIYVEHDKKYRAWREIEHERECGWLEISSSMTGNHAWLQINHDLKSCKLNQIEHNMNERHEIVPCRTRCALLVCVISTISPSFSSTYYDIKSFKTTDLLCWCPSTASPAYDPKSYTVNSFPYHSVLTLGSTTPNRAFLLRFHPPSSKYEVKSYPGLTWASPSSSALEYDTKSYC